MHRSVYLQQACEYASPTSTGNLPYSPGVQLICVFHGGLGRSGGAFDGCGQLCGSSRQAQHSQGINTVAVQGNPRQCQQQKWSIKCKTFTWDESLNILQVWSLNFLSSSRTLSSTALSALIDSCCEGRLIQHPTVMDTLPSRQNHQWVPLRWSLPDFSQTLFGGFWVVSRFGAGDV